MKKIIVSFLIIVASVNIFAADETNCNAGEACTSGRTYVTLDKKTYEYSTKMGVKHAQTREMTIKCIYDSAGDYAAPYSVDLHCTSKALWCSQKHNTGDRVVISCYNSKTSGDTLHLKIDKVDCKKTATGDNGSNTTKVRANGCTWGSIVWNKA